MFPSCGFLTHIDCPFSKRGSTCERPHCLYRHGTETADELDYVPSLTNSAGGVKNGCAESGAPTSHQTQDVCLSELERLDKEIETVKHEVEQEQRRLSYYQIGQTGGRSSQNTSTVSTSEEKVKDSDNTSHGPPLGRGASKMYFPTGKYVVDNSKPRTDLEYDPLSNFSAGLHPGAQQKVKTGQGLRNSRDSEPERTKPVGCRARPPRSPSPEPHDDPIEDGVLVIDIPSSPDVKRGRGLDSGTDKSLKVRKLKEVEEEVPCAPQQRLAKRNVSTVPSLAAKQHAEENDRQTVFLDNSECNTLGKGVPHQSAETETKQVAESATISTFPEPPIKRQENPFQVKSGPYEMSCAAETPTLLQPHHFSPKNSLFYKALVANSDLQCRPPREPLAHDGAAGGCVQGVAADVKAPPPHCPEDAGPGSSWRQSLAADQHSASDCAHAAQPSDSTSGQMIVIESSSDDDDDDDNNDEPNYSAMDLSDSDPMEECYRIFMEENNKDKGNELSDTPAPVAAMDVERTEVKEESQGVAGKTRVAHEAQVLVPLRTGTVPGFTPQPAVTYKLQQVQQRACVLTPSARGAQTAVSTASQRRPDPERAAACPQASKNPQPAPVQNAYVNCLPAGAAFIEVGNNLHLILSRGTFPVAAGSSAVASVLTPIGQMQTSGGGPVKANYLLPVVTAAQRGRPAPAVLIPAPARKPALAAAFPPAHHAPAVPTSAPVKPAPVKRKFKQQSEAAKEKVPHNVRQRYVNMFTEEFLKTTANVNEAFEKALAEEKTVYNRSVNKLKYLSVAVNALKRLKNQNPVAVKGEVQCNSQRLRGSTPLNLNKCSGTGDAALYESLKTYTMTEEKLIESNYPVQHPEKLGCAVLFADNKRGSTDVHKRICCRCGATYSVSQTGKHTRKEECNYHYGKAVTKKVPGGVETRYNCCEGVMGSPGCQVFKLHVHDALSLEGFVQTLSRQPPAGSCPGVYSLDCEMCYTTQGLELSRVTLVNSGLQVVYDTFVRPDHEVIDYNTRFSGVSEEDVKGHHSSLSKVQETLLSFISGDTILVGHSLEMDLCALKLLHGTVVDTSVVFPHRLGPPNKLTLNNLTAEYLRRIIQESGGSTWIPKVLHK